MASEPYGVVELTPPLPAHGRRDPADPDNPTASRGQIIALDGRGAGTLDGIARHGLRRQRRSRSPSDEVQHAQITTRDIDRGGFPHFLLKEISEAPASRSARRSGAGSSTATDGSTVVPRPGRAARRRCRAGLRDGAIRRVQVIGQGTAHIAGQSLAAALVAALPDGRLRVEAAPGHGAVRASGSRDDMADTLVVAISQSGTTTDTNRTVDLAREPRGAGWSPSSTGATATSPTSPTACSTPPTGATWR